jgi:hypothetical protein
MAQVLDRIGMEITFLTVSEKTMFPESTEYLGHMTNVILFVQRENKDVV